LAATDISAEARLPTGREGTAIGESETKRELVSDEADNRSPGAGIMTTGCIDISREQGQLVIKPARKASTTGKRNARELRSEIRVEIKDEELGLRS
jgi:hypothetical protein